MLNGTQMILNPLFDNIGFTAIEDDILKQIFQMIYAKQVFPKTVKSGKLYKTNNIKKNYPLFIVNSKKKLLICIPYCKKGQKL